MRLSLDTSSPYDVYGIVGPMHKKLPPAVDKARRLLFKVYVEEQGWIPGSDNPVNLRIEDGMIVDDYDAVSVWCIINFDGDVIGCGRFTLPIDGLLDVERYTSCPDSVRRHIRNNGGPGAFVTFTKLCVDKRHRGNAEVMSLIAGAGDAFRLMFRLHGLVTAIEDHAVRWHLKRGAVEIENGSFKFETQDPFKVHTLFYLCHNRPSNLQPSNIKRISSSL
ncbi:hypothetical protein BJ742DRAFT_829322 [Cladochytrium replicatum]|nr:hypothetical protein BJ742DRAFT_829322 [Cladochytrium replicatum]